MTQALFYIFKTLTQLYIALYLLRFWMPLVGADFRNPIAQAVLRLTSPLVIPLRRFLPSVGRIDTATVVVMVILQGLVIAALMLIVGRPIEPLPLFIATAVELAILSLYLFMFAIIIRVVLSFVAQGGYHPLGAVAASLSDPILRPFRRLVPPLGGLDLTPLFAFILLQAMIIFLISLKPPGL